jgi:hypothetical protein
MPALLLLSVAPDIDLRAGASQLLRQAYARSHIVVDIRFSAVGSNPGGYVFDTNVESPRCSVIVVVPARVSACLQTTHFIFVSFWNPGSIMSDRVRKR